MKKYIVYEHITPNGKKYIGITCTSPQKRWKNGKGYKESPLFNNAIQKYGWENIENIILFENLTASEAKAKEKELIKQLKTNDRAFGYNITSGGDGAEGYRHSEEAKEKMRLNHADVSGKNNPMYGVKVPKELHPCFGRRKSEETKSKISEALKGRTLSKEHKEKISKANRGEKNYFYGKSGGKSAVAREVLQIGLNNKVIKRWDCISDASRKLGIKTQSICRVCKGGRKTTGGYKWEYV